LAKTKALAKLITDRQLTKPKKDNCPSKADC
jgi:hypothetical protein